ncbi:2-phospho-L-lactate transferase [Marinomonas agarivorans]|nr:2-phospho-L-lactate transferase [Marinomonas agarivorans]
MSGQQITLLAGGVGGAKAAEGLAGSAYAHTTQIIGNVADDDMFHGLWVSPDIDTLIYSLANQIDRQQGWGRKDETHRLLTELAAFGAETWMTLGDLDMATHIYRTHLSKQGVRASAIVDKLRERHGVEIPILLPTDDWVQTRIATNKGVLSFQEYFVRERCQPNIQQIQYEGIETAKPTPEALARIKQSDLILIAPSNPIVSIGPILAVPQVRSAIRQSNAYVIAISPLIQGKTIKGPADKMLQSVGKPCNSTGIYECYKDILHAMVIDKQDSDEAALLQAAGLDVLVTPTLMQTQTEKIQLLTDVVRFAASVKQKNTVDQHKAQQEKKAKQ